MICHVCKISTECKRYQVPWGELGLVLNRDFSGKLAKMWSLFDPFFDKKSLLFKIQVIQGPNVFCSLESVL